MIFMLLFWIEERKEEVQVKNNNKRLLVWQELNEKKFVWMEVSQKCIFCSHKHLPPIIHIISFSCQIFIFNLISIPFMAPIQSVCLKHCWIGDTWDVSWRKRNFCTLQIHIFIQVLAITWDFDVLISSTLMLKKFCVSMKISFLVLPQEDLSFNCLEYF